jgi:amino acid transporter
VTDRPDDDAGPDDPAPQQSASERSASELDDRRDRRELRDRYYGLLQELRVVLPGVQVLVAFLLTVPFSQRFEDLDDTGRVAYLVALVSSLLATVCFVTPTAYHRAGGRTERSARLTWALRATRAGLVAMAVALTSATYGVTRFVFTPTTAWWVTGGLVVAIGSCWIALPVLTATTGRRPDDEAPGDDQE